MPKNIFTDGEIVQEYIFKTSSLLKRQDEAFDLLKTYVGKFYKTGQMEISPTRSTFKATGHTIRVQDENSIITFMTVQPEKTPEKLLITKLVESTKEAGILDKIECAEYQTFPRELKHSPFAGLQLKPTEKKNRKFNL